MFDSGSSLTYIMTGRNHVQGLLDAKNPVDTTSGNSWGTTVHFYASPLSASCYLGHTQLKNMKVSWSDNARLEKFMDDAGIFGLAGNAPFFDKILVLDFKHQQAGVVKP